MERNPARASRRTRFHTYADTNMRLRMDGPPRESAARFVKKLLFRTPFGAFDGRETQPVDCHARTRIEHVAAHGLECVHLRACLHAVCAPRISN